MKIAHLRVTSWAGVSIGAEHYYGKLLWNDNEQLEIKFKVTKEKADLLNTKDRGTSYKAGDMCSRFENEYDLILKGVHLFERKLVPLGYNVLLLGDIGFLDPLPVIAGDEDFLARGIGIWTEFNDLNTYYDRESVEQQDELREEWDQLLETFRPLRKFELRFATKETPSDTWNETYTEEDLKRYKCSTPTKLGNHLINYFNSTLRPYEKGRIYLGFTENG